jgi:hypothetical protein
MVIKVSQDWSIQEAKEKLAKLFNMASLSVLGEAFYKSLTPDAAQKSFVSFLNIYLPFYFSSTSSYILPGNFGPTFPSQDLKFYNNDILNWLPHHKKN